MGKIARIFAEETKRLFVNVVSIVITIGLVVLPSIFAWFNTLASWDVFDNASNLTVAVACEDAGYKGERFPLTINIGEEVISALRADENLGWVFTNADDALEGAKSGKYYAAVIIPADFSEDLLQYCFGGEEQATILYYSNTKISAVAPKITDQGADAVSREINTVLVEAVSEVLLTAIDSARDLAEAQGLDQAVLGLPDDFRTMASRVTFLADTLGLYAAVAANTAQVSSAAAGTVDSLRSELGSVDGVVSGIRTAAQGSLDDVTATLEAAIDELARGIDGAAGISDEAAARAAEARAQVRAALSAYRSELQPAIDELVQTLGSIQADSADSTDALEAACSRLASRLTAMSGELGETAAQLTSTADHLTEVADVLTRTADEIEEALYSDDVETLRTILGSDVEDLAKALSSPVDIVRTAVWPVENFGSAMSPLYTTLALFVGTLLIMVALKPTVSEDVRAKVPGCKRRHVYLGHYLVVLLLATLQSLLMAAGNLFFLQVQVLHPWHYVLCMWAASAVFSLVIYTLVYLFANLGKAVAVILLIMQVTGSSGSFPLELLPHFVNVVSPYLPATYVVGAMRAAMMGIYAGDFWVNLACLALFVVPTLLAGLTLAGASQKIMGAYLAKVESSHLMN